MWLEEEIYAIVRCCTNVMQVYFYIVLRDFVTSEDENHD